MIALGISGLHNAISFKKRELPGLSDREYRIAQGFDSAAALVTDMNVRAAAAEERFAREKGTGTFPAHAIRYCLRSAGIDLSAVDTLAHGFSYEPFRELFAHGDFMRRQFEEVYSRNALCRVIESIPDLAPLAERLVCVPHHLAHAASTFFPSGFDESLILVADGMGEVHSATVAVGRDRDFEVIDTIPAIHSIGLLYGVSTHYLGFVCNQDEYKVMGLAPYGDSSRYFSEFMDIIKLGPRGSLSIGILSKNTTLKDKETYQGTIRYLSGLFGNPRAPESEITKNHKDIAAGLQAAIEAALLHVLRHFKSLTKQSNLCMAGGVALNCVANTVIKRSRLFEKMYVQPASGDDGSALGAALYTCRHSSNGPARARMRLPLLGPDYSDAEILGAIEAKPDCQFRHFASTSELVEEAAARLERSEIIGWFQGRMEFGPRALGNRSILADPRKRAMRERVNALVKKRESFRPFAPAVNAEVATTYFELTAEELGDFETMLFVAKTRPEYHDLLQATTHVDGSSRVQVVAKDSAPLFGELISAFGRRTGLQVLLNTSFNMRGQPIVCSPQDAVDTFLEARLDALFIGNFLVTRKEPEE